MATVEHGFTDPQLLRDHVGGAESIKTATLRKPPAKQRETPGIVTKVPGTTHGVAWVCRSGPGSGAGEGIFAGEILEKGATLGVSEGRRI